MIRKIAFTILVSTMTMLSVFAQKVAVVDIAALLENMPEYTEAQTKLDELAAKWEQEISTEFGKIKSMYNKYEAEQVLLSDEMRKEREEAIIAKEKAVREMQRKKFGPEGELFQRRQSLVEPIQDRVYQAIKDYADQMKIDLMIDKSSSSGLIYSNGKFDRTEEIKRKLNIK